MMGSWNTYSLSSVSERERFAKANNGGKICGCLMAAGRTRMKWNYMLM